MKTIYALLYTQLGWCGIVKGDNGVFRIFLPERTRGRVEACIHRYCPQAALSPGQFETESGELSDYFAGKKTEFSFHPDLSAATAFQRLVWEAATAIPYGEVKTYGWVARRIGKPAAARAVGSALGRNPVPLLVPCHRVVLSGGGLGGFSAPAGTGLKAQLLQLEGVPFSPEMIVLTDTQRKEGI